MKIVFVFEDMRARTWYYRRVVALDRAAQVVAAIGGREDFRRFLVWRQRGVREVGGGSGARRHATTTPAAPSIRSSRYYLLRAERGGRAERATRKRAARPSRNRKQQRAVPRCEREQCEPTLSRLFCDLVTNLSVKNSAGVNGPSAAHGP